MAERGNEIATGLIPALRGVQRTSFTRADRHWKLPIVVVGKGDESKSGLV
jgi:hypothetical protein